MTTPDLTPINHTLTTCDGHLALVRTWLVIRHEWHPYVGRRVAIVRLVGVQTIGEVAAIMEGRTA